MKGNGVNDENEQEDSRGSFGGFVSQCHIYYTRSSIDNIGNRICGHERYWMAGIGYMFSSHVHNSYRINIGMELGRRGQEDNVLRVSELQGNNPTRDWYMPELWSRA